jgi:hypothetical protein
LTKISADRVRDFDNDGVFLDKVTGRPQLAKLATLGLAQWSVTMTPMLMLPHFFQGLVNLELESVTMVSDKEVAWPLALQERAQKHDGSLWMSVDGLKHNY